MKKYLIYIILFLQPILDIITSYQIRYFDNLPFSISSITRLIILAYMVFYIIRNHKKEDMVPLKMCVAMTIFAIAYFQSTSGIMNFLKIIYLPISLLFFANYNQKIDKNKIVILYTVYLLLVIIPTIFGFNFNVYSEEEAKKASLGLFYGGNELSAILLGYLPIVLSYSKDYKLYYRIPFYLLIILSFLFIGTKTLFLGGILVLLIMGINYLIKHKNKYNKYIIGGSIVVLIIGCLLVPYTPIGKNFKITLDYYNIHSIKDVKLSTIDDVIYSKRLTYASNLMSDFNNKSIDKKIFGNGIITMKDSEIDIIDMLYILGIFWLICYLAMMIYLLLTHRLNNIYLLSFILFVLMSCFSGHIFIKPNVIFYIGLLFNLNKTKIKG